MNKIFRKIIPISMMAVVGILVLPKISFSNTLLEITAGTALGLIPQSVVNTMVANISNIFLNISSWFITISGTLLSLSMKITLNIKSLYEGITSIRSLWVVIRDLSSMFIIFVLLYESIKMILGMKGQGFSQTIVKIFIAGMLINFSLFFFKVAIDASNLISLQFYNAITPQKAENLSVVAAFTDGGLSNVFMQSLKIPKIYQAVDFPKGADASLGIIAAAVGGIVMMVMAAISFLAASIAFVARTGILLFILALSPLYFAGIIFPEVKKKVSDKIMGALVSQCLFMPVYLFLMYIALRVISDDGFMNIFNTTIQQNTSSSISSLSPTITLGIFIQYIIAMIFINAPLIVAIEIGAKGSKLTSEKLGGIIGRNTLGIFGRKLGSGFDQIASKAQGNAFGRGASSVLRNLGISQSVRGGLSNLENRKYGGVSLKEVEDSNKKRSKEISALSRSSAQMANINTVLQDRLDSDENKRIEQIKEFRNTISSMGSKEIEELDKDVLMNKKFASQLSSKQIEGLLKSEKLSPQDQEKFKQARADALKELYADPNFLETHKISDHEAIMKEDLTSEQKKEISENRLSGYKKYIESKGAKELMSKVLKGKASDIVKLPREILERDDMIQEFDSGILKKMIDEDLPIETREKVRGKIESMVPANPNDRIGRMREYLARNQAF